MKINDTEMKARFFAKKPEVIKMLESGWEIYTRRNRFTNRKGGLSYDSLVYYISHPKTDESVRVHHSTITSLKSSGIITDRYNYVR